MTGTEIAVAEDRALATVEEQVAQAVATAEALEVRTPDQATLATEALGRIAKQKRDAERERKELTGPLNDHIKLINGKFKDAVAPLAAADKVIRERLGAYQDEVERLRREEEARLEAERQEREAKARAERERQEREAREKREQAEREAREAAAKAKADQDAEAARLADEAKAKADEARTAEQAVAALPTFELPKAVVPEAPALRSASGSVATRKRWTHEIVDESRIPRQYMKVDEQAIRQAIRDGAREIPGVKIEQASELAVRAS